MPVLGPSYQGPPPQPNQVATMGYTGYSGPPHQMGPVPTPPMPVVTMTSGPFVPSSGPGFVPGGQGMAGANMPIGGPGILGMTLHDQAEAARMAQDYEALVNIIKQWNANRLDLFALTLPNELLEFHGVMRFYYQSHDLATGQKVATKCIRVSSTATTKLIIETLIEKFRPDMKMLEVPEYALYEIHESGERRLGLEEKPLLVQLNWHKDDREGRFLLRRIDEATQMSHVLSQNQSSSNVQSASSLAGGKGNNGAITGGLSPGIAATGEFKRKLSKREKKELKKQEKMNKLKNKENSSKGGNDATDEGVAEKLYTEFPDTSFTRSISNPEAVMRRRRQQKLEKKLQQFRSKDGGPDTGGTLKIYGEALCKDVPYKTLLLSVHDSAAYVVEEMLDKYGIDKKESHLFCLVQCTSMPPSQTLPQNNSKGSDQNVGAPISREYYLEDDECPLAILMNHSMNPARGSITFHVRKRPLDAHTRKRKKKPGQFMNDALGPPGPGATSAGPPFLLEMNPDGSEINHAAQNVMPQRFRLSPNVTEVGSDPAIQSGQSLLLPPAQFLHPRHCVLTYTDGIVTVTPIHREAETYVNNQRIYETTILGHGCILRFGRPGHCFRFIDPNAVMQQEQERMIRQTGMGNNLPPGAGGDPYALASQANYVHYGPPRVGPLQGPTMGRDNILPAVLEFREETEEAFFNAISVSLDVNAVQFKLAPTYTIYMATRFRASTHYRPELIPEERAVRLTEMLNGVAERIFATIEENRREAPVLAFWMANASELLHFLKSDRHITSFSHQSQDILAEAIHLAFKQLVVCLQADLEMSMPNLLFDVDDDQGAGELGGQATAGTMNVLSSAMSLLRKCRVNAALTIQLFSQLFHFINMWTFNQIVAAGANGQMINGQKPPNYCTHRWGLRLKKRLSRVESWAEKQGLELAADCHLARVVQAAHLLLARKNTAEDIASVSSICFKLNSVQLKTLLNRYEPAPDENPISKEMIDTIVRVAENTVDEVTNSEGREVRLEEDFVLQLPFLLPEDGYSCDIVRGVPGGLTDFISPLQRVGLCIMTPQPTSSGFWTIYMDTTLLPGGPGSVTPTPSEMSQSSTMINGHAPHHQIAGGPIPAGINEPEVQSIQLAKSNSGMGLSIVAAKGVGKDRLGIYIKAVVEGGAAFHDGRLAAGDQLLRVDGQSLVGITQERAAEIMMHTGQIVELEVAKEGAIYHGLAPLLSQPSPVMSPRGINNGPPPQVPTAHPEGQGRRLSEKEQQQHIKVAQSKSMSALHSPQHVQQDQHTYQNHRPTFSSVGAPPRLPIQSSQQQHPQNMRATSIQNLSGQPPNAQHPPSNLMGQRQASHPALMNGAVRPNYNPQQDLDQSYYQNVGPNGQPQQQLQQHMPLRYHQQQQQRYGSQTSLQQRNNEASQKLSNYSIYPPAPSVVEQRFPPVDEIHHASPRIIGTPMSSSSTPAGNSNAIRGVKPSQGTPTGPEKPQRQYSYHEEQQQSAGERSAKSSTASRVRFQDDDNNKGDDQTDKVGDQFEQLRLSSVEREFRKRIAEYNSGNGINGDGDSGSDSEDRRRMPPLHQSGTTYSATARNKNNSGGSNLNRIEQERMKKLEAVERKQKELEDTNLAEERILLNARQKNLSSVNGSQTPTPPPLPESSPPDNIVNNGSISDSQVQSGAARLDMLVGGVTTNGGSPYKNGLNSKFEAKENNPTKRVSFVTSSKGPEEECNNLNLYDRGVDYDANANLNEDKLQRLELAEERGPNAFISEAEYLLNSSSLALDNSRYDLNKSTGYTPSVIGAQEIYRDPRQKRLQKAEEEKAEKNRRDGAKLSFQEKMKLFAVEAGEKTPNRDKAKISRAQRDLEDEESGNEESTSDTKNIDHQNVFIEN